LPNWVLADEVDAEAAGRALSFHVLDRDAERLAQDVSVVLEPTREIERLVGPHLTERHSFDFADPRDGCPCPS
jgi:hypothetical protein